MENIVEKENSDKDFDSYDQFVGAEVCLPDKGGRKTTAIVTKHVKDNKSKPRRIGHPTLFEYH